MSTHDLMNVLNELRKRLNARLAEHFISFSQRVSIYHMTRKLLKIAMDTIS